VGARRKSVDGGRRGVAKPAQYGIVAALASNAWC